MSKSYEAPEWSCLPPDGQPCFSLEVLKDGVIVEEIALGGKEYFLLGRQRDAVDIPMDHPSISRVHAVLNYRDDGALMLLDLQSAQGSMLNKKRCDSDNYYRVYVGDMLQFGASTRKYIVGGPEEQRPAEYNSENMEKYRQHLQEKTQKAAKKKKVEEINGISWGISADEIVAEEDAVPEIEEDESKLPAYLRREENFDRKYGDKFSVDIKDEEVNEKDQGVLEKIRKKERKIQNMQEEIRRIYLKENNQEDGLTAGQLAAVDRNDKAIAQLSEEIVVLVQQLKSKELQRQHGRRGEVGKGKKRTQEDDDNVQDETKDSADVATNWRMKKKLARLNHSTAFPFEGNKGNSGKALSYIEIKAQLDVVTQNRQESQVGLEQVERSITELTSESAASDIDRIIIKDKEKDLQDKKRKLFNEKSQLDAQFNSLSRLLHAATPALQSLVSNKPAGSLTQVNSKASSSSSNVSSISADESNSGNNNKNNKDRDVVIVKEDVKSSVLRPGSESFEKSQDDSTVVADASPSPSGQEKTGKMSLEAFKQFVEKERANELQHRSNPFQAHATQSVEVSKPSENVIQIKLNGNSLEGSVSVNYVGKEPMVSNKEYTASTVPNKDTIETEANTVVKPKDAKRKGSAALPAKSASLYSGNMLEGGEAVWVPPKNQSGDGRTTLNDKLGY